LSYTTDYCKLVDKHDMNQAPSILMALHKLDDNKDATKRKELFDTVATVITKWDATWTTSLQQVTDPKDKLARQKFAGEVRKMKQALQAAAGKAVPYDKPLPPIPGKGPYDKPLPPIPGKVPPAPPPPMPMARKAAPTRAAPYKKTTFGSAYLKARAEVPFGAAAVALWHLDKAETGAEAKLLAVAARTALERELVEIDAVMKGDIEDEDRKRKVNGYRVVLRQTLEKVRAVAK
jgi:hypothetical protein